MGQKKFTTVGVHGTDEQLLLNNLEGTREHSSNDKQRTALSDFLEDDRGNSIGRLGAESGEGRRKLRANLICSFSFTTPSTRVSVCRRRQNGGKWAFFSPGLV